MTAAAGSGRRPRFGGLWRHPDFLRLWTAQTVSVFGSQITVLALPLTAVLVLDATPAQMGLLNAFNFAPFLLVGLFAGVWVDRLPRRPILIAGDIGRALLLGTIPLASALDALRIEQLYIVGFCVGALTVFFDVAYQSFLPSLVDRTQLVEGNSKLEMTRSLAQVGGPGMAGGLVQLLSGPAAILLDALSFLASALFIGLIGAPEPPPYTTERRSIWNEISEGMRLIAGNPVLRATAASTATSNLFGSVITATMILYATRTLGLSAGAVGVIFGIAGAGGVVGALVVGRVADRFGLGNAIIGGMAALGFSALLIPLAAGSPVIAAALLTIAFALMSVGGVIFNVNHVSLRQTITPDRLMGRMNATMRFLVWGTIPIGALLGGALGERFGLRPALVIGAIGQSAAVLWLVFSPVRGLTSARDALRYAPSS